MSEAKVALVTGSSSGIGEAIVLLLSSKGYKVAVHGSNKEKVERVVAGCFKVSPQKFQPLALVLSFSEPDNGDVAVKKTIEHFGRLDVLVNNAGMFARTSIDDSPGQAYETYRKVMAINTDATVNATMAAIAHLKEAEGDLIFVSSVASKKAVQRGFAYCMSKAAMTSFAKCLAIELAPIVRVNVVSPGPILTSILGSAGVPPGLGEKMFAHTTLEGRIGQPDEIAQTVAFLLSDGASFIRGHDMVVDGGYLLKPSTNSVASTIISSKKE